MSPTPEARRQRHRIWVGVALIVASLVVIAIGVQSYLYQREQAADTARETARTAADRAQQQCFERWGKHLVATVRVRSNVGTAVEQATAHRSDLLDDVLLLLNADDSHAPPPRAVAVERAAHRYYAAIRNLREVRANAKAVRNHNPYPKLDC